MTFLYLWPYFSLSCFGKWQLSNDLFVNLISEIILVLLVIFVFFNDCFLQWLIVLSNVRTQIALNVFLVLTTVCYLSEKRVIFVFQKDRCKLLCTKCQCLLFHLIFVTRLYNLNNKKIMTFPFYYSFKMQWEDN